MALNHQRDAECAEECLQREAHERERKREREREREQRETQRESRYRERCTRLERDAKKSRSLEQLTRAVA